MTELHTEEALWTAALRLSAAHPWNQVTLQQIATEASLSLSDVAAVAASKADVLRLFQAHNDRLFLKSLDEDPLEGEIHDKLFDAMLRRVELLTPYKSGIRSISQAPADGPGEWLTVASSAMRTQNWILMAVGFESAGLRGDVQKLGLTAIYRDVLRIWLDDDDPGMARTMATLDRRLRDAATMLRRIEMPLNILSGFARAARAFRQTTKRENSTSDATAD